MKKIILIMCVSLLLVGCGDGEVTKVNDNPTTSSTTTTSTISTTTTEKQQFQLEIGKKYVNNSNGIEEILLKENGKVEASACAKEGGCSDYKGTYKIENNTLTIVLTQMYDNIEWRKINEKSTYEIIADNKFKRAYKDKEYIYILK